VIECRVDPRDAAPSSLPRPEDAKIGGINVDLRNVALAWTGRVLSICRIVAGLVFVTEGTMKLFNYPPAPVPGFPAHFPSEMAVAGVIETFGGVAILIGLFTRPVAFVLAGEMAVAYFQQHFPKSIFPTVNGGIPAILYCFLYLYLVFAGAGPWSIDAMIARAKYGDRAAIAGIGRRDTRRATDAAA
jgi:putative oxidoreductase